MADLIRCPACRGSKKVPKLGGMIGECNTCSGKGTILAVDKPKPVVAEVVESSVEVIKAVEKAVPCEIEPIVAAVKVEKADPKKVIYKRKTR